MQDASAVTVVIPTHNRRDLLLRALRSVRGQRDVDVGIVVVDDGGRDGTVDAIRRLALPGVRVLRHQRSRGVSAARNAGLATVETPWVAFVDDDDLWAPDKLAAQLGALRNHPTARWSCVGAVHVDAALRVVHHAPAPPGGDVQGDLLVSNAIPGGGSGVLAETAVVRSIGGFDEQISILADWDFNLRLSRRSPVASVNRPLLAYFVHQDSMFHDPHGLLRELSYLEHKHRGAGRSDSLVIDRVGWSITAAGMALRTGDRVTAAKMLLQGMARSGFRPLARHVLRPLRWHRHGSDGAFRFQEPVHLWLSSHVSADRDVAHP